MQYFILRSRHFMDISMMITGQCVYFNYMLLWFGSLVCSITKFPLGYPESYRTERHCIVFMYYSYTSKLISLQEHYYWANLVEVGVRWLVVTAYITSHSSLNLSTKNGCLATMSSICLVFIGRFTLILTHHF